MADWKHLQSVNSTLRSRQDGGEARPTAPELHAYLSQAQRPSLQHSYQTREHEPIPSGRYPAEDDGAGADAAGLDDEYGFGPEDVTAEIAEHLRVLAGGASSGHASSNSSQMSTASSTLSCAPTQRPSTTLPVAKTSGGGVWPRRDAQMRAQMRKLCAGRCGADDPKQGDVGLHNLGNTCFMNSIVQCLSFTRPLTAYLLHNRHASDRCRTSPLKGHLLEAYAGLIRELWGPATPAAIAPRRLKSEVHRLARRFMGYEQQDAHEFLRFLLDGLHKEVNRVEVPPQYTANPDEIDARPVDEQLDYHMARHRAREDSAVHDMFAGLLRSTLQCDNCGHRSHTWDPFSDVSLEISPSAATLLDLFDDFVQPEPMEGDERPRCGGCKQRASCTKSIAFETLPEILVVHLKRFSYTGYRGRKINVNIRFLNKFDVGKYCTDPERRATYRLYAASMHSGSMLAGHYTAMCRHPGDPNLWLHFNDSLVREASKRDFDGADAYVMFYERIRETV